jgi:serine/threonine protein kinase
LFSTSLTGALPWPKAGVNTQQYSYFAANGLIGLYKGYRDIDLSFPRNISEHALALCSGMMTIDPATRLTLRQVLDHPWMRSVPSTMPRAVVMAQAQAAAQQQLHR